MPNDKLIKYNNKLFAQFGNALIEIPNITNSSNISVLSGMYTSSVSTTSVDSSRIVNITMSNSNVVSFNNVLMYYHIADINASLTVRTNGGSWTSYNTFQYNYGNQTIFNITFPQGNYPSGNNTQSTTISGNRTLSLYNTNSISFSRLYPTFELYQNSSWSHTFVSTSINIVYHYFVVQYVA